MKLSLFSTMTLIDLIILITEILNRILLWTETLFFPIILKAWFYSPNQLTEEFLQQAGFRWISATQLCWNCLSIGTSGAPWSIWKAYSQFVCQAAQWGRGYLFNGLRWSTVVCTKEHEWNGLICFSLTANVNTNCSMIRYTVHSLHVLKS